MRCGTFCLLSFVSGLPAGWSTPCSGTVKKSAVSKACPWIGDIEDRGLPSSAVTHGHLVDDCFQDPRKHKVISMFSGILGLDLGAAQP